MIPWQHQATVLYLYCKRHDLTVAAVEVVVVVVDTAVESVERGGAKAGGDVGLSYESNAMW